MATGTEPNVVEQVARIEILDGPNGDGLLRAYKFAVARDGLPVGISARFEGVFFDEDDNELAELGRTFLPPVVGLHYLNYEATDENRDQHVIAVQLWATFEGHYDAFRRKGNLYVVR